MLAGGTGRNMERERVGFSKWSCLVLLQIIYVFPLFRPEFCKLLHGKQLYTHEWSNSVQDTSSLPNDSKAHLKGKSYEVEQKYLWEKRV